MKNKNLLSISIICFISFSLTVDAQKIEKKNNIYKTELKKNTWITNEIIGLDAKTKKYVLTKFTEQTFAGFLVSFKEDNIYTSFYVAPCGNDYFTTVNGRYKFLNKDKISFIVDSVSYFGMAKKPTEYRKPKKLLFKISKENENIILRKIKK